MPPILIVGLGNPGDKYVKTRHNAGFLALDALAKKLHAPLSMDNAHHAEIAETNENGIKIILAKPQTYMNDSGASVRTLKERFGVETKNVWVVSDDATLPLGTLRVRMEGSAGGHNGLKSVIERLGTDAFPRFKIGVDAPPPNVPMEAWVLSHFSPDEMVILKEVITQTVEAIMDGMTNGLKQDTHRGTSEV